MERTHTEVNWHTETLPPATAQALRFFSQEAWLEDSTWYLAGGTALALHAGHRRSEDLDFFTTQKDFAPNDVLKHLAGPDWRSERVENGTVFGSYKDAKVSFISYPFFIPKETTLRYGTIAILSPRDIAVMKIIALSQRGKKRAFVDLYWYGLNQESLIAVIRRLPSQYPSVAHNYHHILKSFLYFADAENDPMPQLHFKADWDEIKAYFRREVPKIASTLLGL